MRKLVVVSLCPAMFAIIASAQSKPTLVVNAFTVAENVPRSDAWEGDVIRSLQASTVVKLRARGSKYFEVVTQPPKETNSAVYTLGAEVLQWCDTFNTCRGLMPETSVGGDRAKLRIHYWLINQSGNKIAEYTDTFSEGPRAIYPPGEYLSDLAKPFADKFFKRLRRAKLF
ncbi:MAG TPA: hypothetical protein VGR72_14270 [Candidatus Acidoferrales bacterium]|nr:hypothetical protein [Candidatus Acidoferrales bacterium]